LSESAKPLSLFLLALFFTLGAATLSEHSSAALSSSDAYIDQTLLRSTIPASIILGKSYTAQVLVVNNSTQVLSGLVILNLPLYYFYTDNPTQTFQLLPGESEHFYYRFVAGNTDNKPLNVSASLLLYDGSKLVAGESVSLPVNSIVHSPLVNDIWQFSLLGVVVGGTTALIILFYKRIRRRPGGLLRASNPVEIAGATCLYL